MRNSKSKISNRESQKNEADLRRIDKMSEDELKGEPDLKAQIPLELMTGQMSDTDMRLGIFALRAKVKGRTMQSHMRADVYGARLLLSEGITREQALAFVAKFEHIIDNYFAALLLNPGAATALIDDANAEVARQPQPAEDDNDPVTWSKRRIDAATKAITRASSILFLKSSEQTRERFLASEPDHLRHDAQSVARMMIDCLTKSSGKPA